MTRPEFLSLSPAQIAEIRAEKGVSIIIEWMEWERDRARDLVLQATLEGKGNEPIIRAGSAVTFEHILRALKTPVAIAEIADDDFVDPARSPRRPRKAPDAQV